MSYELPPDDREAMLRRARLVLVGDCRLVVPLAKVLEELGQAGVDAMLQLPERVQLLATDLLAHHEREHPVAARFLAQPRVGRLLTDVGRLYIEAAARHARYTQDPQFRADWDSLDLPMPIEPEAPAADLAVVMAAHHIFHEDPPGLPVLVLAPRAHFECYAAGGAVIDAGVLAQLLAGEL